MVNHETNERGLPRFETGTSRIRIGCSNKSYSDVRYIVI